LRIDNKGEGTKITIKGYMEQSDEEYFFKIRKAKENLAGNGLAVTIQG
jgi:hypothetical protein